MCQSGRTLRLHFHGACRSTERGPAGVAVRALNTCLGKPGTALWQCWHFFSAQLTSEEAVYCALILGLERLLVTPNEKMRVEVCGASQLLMAQVQGHFSANSAAEWHLQNRPYLRVLHAEAISLLQQLRTQGFRCVLRCAPDVSVVELANKALDSQDDGFVREMAVAPVRHGSDVSMCFPDYAKQTEDMMQISRKGSDVQRVGVRVGGPAIFHAFQLFLCCGDRNVLS